MRHDVWSRLSNWAEAMTSELLDIEREILVAPGLQELIALPASLRSVLADVDTVGATPAASRVMRFDFHWTTCGWQVSEVNSDVPGGFCEASSFTALIGERYPELSMAGDPAGAWADALLCGSHGRAPIALLSAPGFMEDQQIMAYLAQQLRDRNCGAYLASPEQLRWSDGRTSMHTNYYAGPLRAIVRFFQGEWLASLPERVGWKFLFSGGKTPVANPGIALLIESKRLPLAWPLLSSRSDICRRLFPETCDPRDVEWFDDARWLVKSAFCNTGDTVGGRGLLEEKRLREIQREVRRAPQEWLAQRRFEVVPVESPLGAVYPCIGVYTVNGKTAGAYARISTGPVIDYLAIDIAVLIEAPEG
jgi:glutathionylspermidine synthase